MSAPVPEKNRHRTDLGTKVKSDATLIRVETDSGLTGIGAALGTPPIVEAIVVHELAAECIGEDPMFSERIYEKMYNGSRAKPALERGVTQADESRRRGRHHGGDCRRRYRRLGRQGPGTGHSALSGAWRGAQLRCAATPAAAGRRATRPRPNSAATRPRASPPPRCAWSAATDSRSPTACAG